MLCDKNKSKKCPARLQYDVDENNEKINFKLTDRHNHSKPEVDASIREFENEFKKQIMATSIKPCIIYTNLCLRCVF